MGGVLLRDAHALEHQDALAAQVVALMINQFYNLFALGQFGVWTVVAFVFLALMLFQLFRPMPKFDTAEKQ